MRRPRPRHCPAGVPTARCGGGARARSGSRWCSSAALDDALPGGRRLDGLAPRQESGLAASDAPWAAVCSAARRTSVAWSASKCVDAGRCESHIDGLPDAHDQGVSPRRQLGSGLRDGERSEFGSVVGEEHRPGGSDIVTMTRSRESRGHIRPQQPGRAGLTGFGPIGAASTRRGIRRR